MNTFTQCDINKHQKNKVYDQNIIMLKLLWLIIIVLKHDCYSRLGSTSSFEKPCEGATSPYTSASTSVSYSSAP